MLAEELIRPLSTYRADNKVDVLSSALGIKFVHINILNLFIISFQLASTSAFWNHFLPKLSHLNFQNNTAFVWSRLARWYCFIHLRVHLGWILSTTKAIDYVRFNIWHVHSMIVYSLFFIKQNWNYWILEHASWQY